MNNRLYFCVLAMLIGACSKQAPEEIPSAVGATKNKLTGDAPGFELGYSSTACNIGTVLGTRGEGGLERTFGTYGVFGIFSASRGALCVPNAAAPSQDSKFTGSADDHNNMVRNHFVVLGVPSDQIGGVGVNAAVVGGIESMTTIQPMFEYYFSTLSRVVEGIRVPDSVAAASFNGHNEVVKLALHWPAIPEDVVNAAKALQATVDDPTAFALFQARLPPGLPLGKVVIHHSKYWTETFISFASYDVTIENSIAGMSYKQHFALDGSELQTLEEQHPVPPDSPK